MTQPKTAEELERWLIKHDEQIINELIDTIKTNTDTVYDPRSRYDGRLLTICEAELEDIRRKYTGMSKGAE